MGTGTVPAPAADAVQQAIEVAADAAAAARQAAQDAAQAAEAVRQEAALMQAWGVAPGELERMPFDQRARLAERLRSGRLAQWAGLIGRFRQMARGERARKVENAACALALLDQARHAGRDFVGILFSAADKIQVFRFPAGPPASTGSSTSRRPSSAAEPATRRR